MRRIALLERSWHITLAGVFFILLPAEGEAQTFILQGEKGDMGEGLQCDAGTCVVPSNQALIVNGDLEASGTVSADSAEISGDLDVAGWGHFGSIETDLLTVRSAISLPECPAGYRRDETQTGYTLCQKSVGEGRLDEMVKVGDFWIDRYEVSAWENSDCTGNRFGDSEDNWEMHKDGSWSSTTPAAYACSVSGVLPSAHMTWFQAAQICQASGKSLCSNADWQAAVASTFDPPEPYSGMQCNILADAPRATGLAGNTPADVNECVSSWGAEDMIGNLSEWTSDWYVTGPIWQESINEIVFNPWPTGFPNDITSNCNGTVEGGEGEALGLPAASVRGGSWIDGMGAGTHAFDLRFGPSYQDEHIGARCCRRL